MRQSALRPVALGAIVAVLLAACGTPEPSTAVHEEPAIVEPIDGAEGLHRITLTERAAQRLGIEVTPTSAAPGAGSSVRVPYSSIIYDAHGAAWAYVVEAPLVFEREAVTVADVVSDAAGGYAILSQGPAVGTEVVSVGVAELFGTEFEVGH